MSHMPPSPFLESVASRTDQLTVARTDELQTVAATASADGDFIQSSDGGVEGHALCQTSPTTQQLQDSRGPRGVHLAGIEPGTSEAFPSSPALLTGSHNSGEADPSVMPDYGAGEAFRVPPGYVLIPQPNFDRMMELIVELQAEREADRIDHADYERLREKERIELLTPPPSFLKRPDFSRAMERDAA